MFITLLWWSFFGLIVYYVWYRAAKAHEKEMKISPLTIIFAIVLTITVASFFILVWEDITDSIMQGRNLWKLSDQERAAVQFKSILYHTGFVIPIVLLALMLYFSFYKKGRRYSAMIMPYLIGSLFMIGRLLFDIGDYIVREYKRAGMYAILVVLMIVFSVIVFFVQQKWEERKKELEQISTEQISTK